MPNPIDFEKKHRRNMSVIEAEIERVFKKATEEAAKIGVSLDAVLPDDKIFSFEDFPETKIQIERLIRTLQESVIKIVLNGVRGAWALSNDKNNALVSQVLGGIVDKLPQEQYKRYFSTNGNALEAFIKRKERGLNLSDRVWKYTNAFKNEIELGLDLGIRTGESAASMTRSLRQYLQYPDKLFRRVRDKHGILQLSKAAQVFHPGRGVYRSSYMNARRLAATETNIAYRTADHLRWQDLDFVVGVRVVLSNNHTCLGSDGKPHKFTDICDELSAPFGSLEVKGKGCYPKDFKFTGWHPHCRCHAESILKTEEEMAADSARMLRGEEPQEKSVNKVTDVPQEFKDWLDDNKERAKRSTSVPYFISDNENYLPNGYKDLYALKTPYETYSEYVSAMKYNKKYANFTPEVLKNNRDLDQALPVMQGKIMTFTEADRGHSNPHFTDVNAKEAGYHDNCQTCTVAFELRRRGFPVEALPNKDDEFYKVWCVRNNFNWEDRFLNPDGSRPKRIRSGYDVEDTKESKKAFLEEASKETGRYEVYMDWKGNNAVAHVFIIERQKDGNLLWFDPQSGARGDSSSFSGFLNKAKRFNMTVLRIDDKIINPKFAERLIKSSK